MIEARGLVKRYGSTIAVDNLSFDVRPGTVTGFLGPNGAGKSTTMRMMLGLDRPDAGTVRISGKSYHDLRSPLREVGALLEAKAFHPGRTARAHLTALAASNSIPKQRVSEVLEITGLEKAAGRRAGTFSLGMSQRLGIAAALLGDPPVLLLDEPVNGLDPEGIRWIRNLLKRAAPSTPPATSRTRGACLEHRRTDSQYDPGRTRLQLPLDREDGVAEAAQRPLHVVDRARVRGRHDRLVRPGAEPRALGRDVRRRPRRLRPGNTAAAISAVVGMLFVLTLILLPLGYSIQNSVGQFMPMLIAENSLTAVKPQSHTLSPGLGFAMLCVYAAVALAAGGWALARRDA